MVNRFITSTAAAALLLLTSVQGHMVMRTPPSYNLYNGELLQVNPLDGEKYLYPCQNRYQAGNVTTVKAGDVQLVQFTGAAQHGGGSCQFSVSYDDPETSNGWNASATFKTIYTIIGGCPGEMRDESKNLAKEGRPKDSEQRENTDFCGNDSGVDCTREFLIPIPDLNCAPVEITGGKPSPEKYNSLPIFVANIPTQKNIPGYDGCVTGGGAAYVLNIPNPGKYGRTINQLNKPFGKPDAAPPKLKLCPKIDDVTLPKFEDNTKTIMKGDAAAPTGGEVNAGASASASASGTGKPPAATTTSAPAAGVTGTKTKTESSISIVNISSSSVGFKVEGASGTFITAPSDGSAPTATASATGGTGGSAAESGSGGAEKSEGGECHDANATETGAGTGEGGAETTIEVTTSMTLMVTITTAGPPAASASAFASASASTASAVPSGLGDSANNAAGDSVSGSGGANDGGPREKKKCEKDQVSVCFGDDYFGLYDHGWAVPQKVSQGTRCENGSLVHSAVQRGGGKRAEGYAAGDRHARRHLKRRAGRSL
ncbi:hypothetical protein N0V85_004730 [Neurospora sp. IMI 360204]|nr:hypothetical protein N0V85_004730 [Neurospora sp. IMI 360204]